MVEFQLNGTQVQIDDEGCSLLEALRDHLGVRSVKDGCSPQGQCGCCTVWIDGSARVACVTPVKRAAGRAVTTIEGLLDAEVWADGFCAAGASQCGFCTPGIVMRLAAQPAAQQEQPAAVRKALLAHLCRCTGWNSIVEATVRRTGFAAATRAGSRDLALAERRAALEGDTPQRVSPDVVLGNGGFADDQAPDGALVAVRSADGSWVVAATLSAARLQAAKVQGRRTTAPLAWPIAVPTPESSEPWARTLQTTWVEPAYLEPDSAWCEPGGEPASPLGNGGAFGGKVRSEVGSVARRLADEHGVAVRVLFSREDTVLLGPKRPPLAVGLRRDGSGIACIARPESIEDESQILDLIAAVAPLVEVKFVDAVGPSASAAIRASCWAEIAAVGSGVRDGPDVVTAPNGATARASWTNTENSTDPASDSARSVGTESLLIEVRCGEILDEVVLRSYCLGAAHMAMGWVLSEGLAVDAAGVPLDLTVRSFGVLRAVDTPHIEVTLVPDDAPPTNGSDAVFAAVAAATWRRRRFPPRWPTNP